MPLDLMALEQHVRLDAVVRLLNAGVGVVNRTDAYPLGFTDFHTCAYAIFEVKSRNEFLVASRN